MNNSGEKSVTSVVMRAGTDTVCSVVSMSGTACFMFQILKCLHGCKLDSRLLWRLSCNITGVKMPQLNVKIFKIWGKFISE